MVPLGLSATRRVTFLLLGKTDAYHAGRRIADLPCCSTILRAGEEFVFEGVDGHRIGGIDCDSLAIAIYSDVPIERGIASAMAPGTGVLHSGVGEVVVGRAATDVEIKDQAGGEGLVEVEPYGSSGVGAGKAAVFANIDGSERGSRSFQKQERDDRNGLCLY